ncbi:MAG: cysteine peptidase family C39 domain-containing protein, partial [Vampirovibrionia bacterium]
MQTGLISFEVVSKLNQLDVDLRSIIREYGISDQELSKNELMRIIKSNGFKAKLKTIDVEKTSKYPMPAIFIFKDQTYGVLLKINYDEKKALLFLPTEKATKEVTFEEFKELSTGELFIMHHKIFNDNVKFGFKWFYKEILHYKQIIGEVLIGSFIVQLFGLITPLFTQVILDKVI